MTHTIVSFVIPVLNAEPHIAKTLLSIRNLDSAAVPHEIIIIDNGSTDGTTHIIQKMGFHFQTLRGVNVSALRNAGAALAQGRFLAFVDSDVELSHMWLQKGLKAFEDQDVVAAGCIPRVPPDSTWVQSAWDIHQRGRHSTTEPTAACWLSAMNVLVRREEFLKVSGFNEQLASAEDVDLFYRLGRGKKLLTTHSMDAIHWGEAKDLLHFIRKEVWRGAGNLEGVLAHGLRWEEIPSLGYPIYILLATAFLFITCVVDFLEHRLSLTPLAAALIFLPALILSLSTAFKAKRFAAIFPLFILYLFYGFSRAFSFIQSFALLFIRRVRGAEKTRTTDSLSGLRWKP